MKYHLNFATVRGPALQNIMFLLSPHAPPAARNMEDFQYSEWKWSFTGTLLLCALSAASYFLCVYVSKYICTSPPPSWCSPGSYPKPVTLLRPALRGSTVRADGHTEAPQTAAACYMNTKARLFLSFFTPPPERPSPSATRSPAPPHNLLVHSPSESHLCLLLSCISVLLMLSCMTNKVGPVRREEINDGRQRRMKACPTRFIIRWLLYHTVFAPPANCRAAQVCPRCLATWTSLFTLPC